MTKNEMYMKDTRRQLNKAKRAAQIMKEKKDRKNIEKIKRQEKKPEKLPEECTKYAELSIFSAGNMDSRERSINLGYEQIILYGVNLNKQEQEALRLQPKFALYDNLKMSEFEQNVENMCTMLRYQVRNECDEKDNVC